MIGAGVALGGGNADVATTAPVLQADEAAVPLTVPDSVPDVVATVATTSPVAKSQLDRTLAKGVAGGDVQEVQQRLTDLGFAPGPTTASSATRRIKAVWAYEKLVLGVDSNQPTGQITPEMWDRDAGAVRHPTAPTGLDTQPHRGVPARAGARRVPGRPVRC